MCGIAGIHVKKPGLITSQEGLESFVNHLLLGIEKRGPHSTGFVATTFGKNRKTVSDKAAVTASEFIKTRDKIPENPQTILLHTRYATKGAVEDHRNNHPVLHKTCFAVHNGHINNDDELFEKFSLDRYGQVDSEIIPALAHHVGMDDPTAFLSQFEGYMATAIIDPVNFPGRLVLAKGKWSPIVSFENDRFLVFASEMSAIKEAWAHVLGTPPKYNKFKTWKEGEYWVYDDAQKEEATFPVPDYIKKYTNKTNTNKGNSVGYGAPPIDEDEEEKAPHWFRQPKAQITAGPSELDDNTKRELAVRAIVRAARAQSKDWIKTVPMQTMTNETREEVFEMFPELDRKLKWVSCPSCDTFVVAPFLEQTPNWGKICVDCRTANVHYYQRKAELAAKEDENEVEDSKVEWIDAATITKLREFIDIELDLHTEALVQVSDEVDVDVSIIDWLVFRAPDSYFEQYPLLSDVAAEFGGMYEEFMEALWQEKNAEPLPQERAAVLDYCSEHGNYYDKEANCADCVLDAQWKAHHERERAAAAFPTVGGVGIESSLATPVADMKVCGCGKFAMSLPCIICRNKDENKELAPTTPRKALAPGPQPVGVRPKAADVDEKCVSCGSGAEFLVPRNGWAWCVDCFVECGEPENGVPCTGLCNHTDPIGVRVCHVHARGRSGVIADKLLKARYGDFIELGRF